MAFQKWWWHKTAATLNQNHTLSSLIKWSRVSRFLSRYWITPQTTTEVSPAELLLGRKPKLRLDPLYPEIGGKVHGSQMSQKQRHDLHVKERTMIEGNQVYARNFGQVSQWVPGVVRQWKGPTTYEVTEILWTSICYSFRSSGNHCIRVRRAKSYCPACGRPHCESRGDHSYCAWYNWTCWCPREQW